MKHHILHVCLALAVAAAAGACANETSSTLEPKKIDMSKFTEKNGFEIEDAGVVTSVVFYTPEIVRVTKTPAQGAVKPFVTPTVILSPEKVAVQVDKSASEISAKSSALNVVLDRKTGAISFLKPDGTRLLAEDAAEPFKMAPVTYPSGKTNTVTAKFRIDPDEDVFTAPLNMLTAVQDYCEKHGQGRPETVGEIAVAAYNGLSRKIGVHARKHHKSGGE